MNDHPYRSAHGIPETGKSGVWDAEMIGILIGILLIFAMDIALMAIDTMAIAGLLKATR